MSLEGSVAVSPVPWLSLPYGPDGVTAIGMVVPSVSTDKETIQGHGEAVHRSV